MKLKELQKNAKLTIKEAAENLEINVNTYKNYISNQREPDIETLKKIAHYYGVSLDYLCEYENPSKLELGFITEEQKALIGLIPQLNKTNLIKATGYIAGLLAGQE